MNRLPGGVCGDLLQWARVQQGLTMRSVANRGGPSISFQSEVETGKKREVHSNLLTAWVRALGVTEDFAYGRVSRFHDAPDRLKGLAEEIRLEVIHGGETNWEAMRATDRMVAVLRLIATRSVRFPTAVLAYTLGLTVRTLEDIMAGQHPLGKEQVRAILCLTCLPESFLLHGHLTGTDQNGHASAEYLRLTPDTVAELLTYVDFLPALRLLRQAGKSPKDLIRLMELQLPVT